jgi:hypothetical protein
MMRMSGGMIDVASGLMCGVANHLTCDAANHPICGVANHLMCDAANHPIYAGVNGRRSDGQTRAVTEIVVAGPIRAPAMVPTTCCRMANAGRTSAAEPTTGEPS